MRVKLWNKCSLIIGVSIALNAFPQEPREVHFEQNIEKKCTSLVRSVGCGTPTEENQEDFIKCIDTKIDQLPADCKEMHQSIKANRHHQH